ncbi:hypothetical protein PR202_ga26289 [Eleusine coracana subsp. coracana]|uniref:Uncharacterized protein n=1 Tax=Eleusine coracana subsp. coracana TaxID=191504 RepID=A0AAV5DDV1_ELECO|nr:hypothetical protein PR202_ga26289 [Eleusine coracana subsp. coracana]
MTSRDKVGCPPVALPLDRVLAALAANAEQLGKQWEAAVRSRCGKAEAAGGEAEGKRQAIEMHTPLFYATCALGGVLSTGLTHLAVTPLDLVKCNMQVDPSKYRDISTAFGVMLQEQGLGGFFKGWMATLVGLYKGLLPLWGRQVPYTMMKFACFETIVEMVYKHAVPKPKDQCSKPLQLAVSFAGGYIAGVFCAAISHPADNLVSFLNNAQGATVADAVRTLGMWGLFTRGLPLRIIMVGTLTGAQWATYDAFKVFVGLPTSGGVNPSCASAATLHRMGHEKQN